MIPDAVYDASVVGTDPSTDPAVIKVDAPESEMKPLALGDSTDVKVGDPVVAIGNPFGLDRTVTTGIVSALQREISSLTNYAISNVIQTDAAINPGNSGGPLIDANGNVIGVNSQIATGSGSSTSGNVGIGFAIPSNTVKGRCRPTDRDGRPNTPTSESAARRSTSSATRAQPRNRHRRPRSGSAEGRPRRPGRNQGR